MLNKFKKRKPLSDFSKAPAAPWIRPLAVAGSALIAALGQPAAAQVYATNPVDPIVPVSYNRDRNQSVAELPRPEYAPIGVHLGGFVLYPTVDASVGTTSNVYQVPTGQASDVYTRISPGAVLASSWSVHSLQLITSGDLVRYAQHPARNQNGWNVEGRGRYDVSADASVNVAAKIAQMYENTVFTGALANALTAAPYTLAQARVLADVRFSRVRVVANGDYSDYSFSNVTDLSGVVQQQSYRDRGIGRGALQLEYAIRPDMGVFLQGSVTSTDYKQTLTDGTANRSSTEYRLVGGVTADLSSLIRGNISVGYLSREYRSVNFVNNAGLAFDVKVEYFPSRLTTVTASTSRAVRDASGTTAGGYFATTGTLKIDHELRKNLLAYIGGSYEKDTYKTLAGSVEILTGAAGGTYLANRWLKVLLDINYSERLNHFVGGQTIREFRPVIGVNAHI